jgi:hypothetical protein
MKRIKSHYLVMAGLVPAIHALLLGQGVDARMRGHDGSART